MGRTRTTRRHIQSRFRRWSRTPRPASSTNRDVFLLAWRQVGPKGWEGLVTWVITTRSGAGAVRQKHVEWVSGEQLRQAPAEALRDRYKKVPRFKQ